MNKQNIFVVTFSSILLVIIIFALNRVNPLYLGINTAFPLVFGLGIGLFYAQFLPNSAEKIRKKLWKNFYPCLFLSLILAGIGLCLLGIEIKYPNDTIFYDERIIPLFFLYCLISSFLFQNLKDKE